MRNIVIIFLFLVPALLFGGGKKEQELSASPEEQSIYRINAIDIQVEGRTQAFAIKDAANITSGTLIRGKKNLDAYIAEKKQFLTSQRVFENSALAFSVGDIDENNQIPVDLSISVKDSSNFVIVPAFKYDSNEGLFLKISPRNFNFFGTLTPMILGIGYERDTEGNNGFLLESDISLPFEFGGYIWTFDFANQLDIMQNSPTFYSNDLGLLVDIPLNVTTLTFGLYESIYVNEENDNRIKAAEGEFFRDVWYLNTTALARWNIPTGLKIFDFGELEYTPELDFSINYRPGGEIGDSRRGFEITLKQSLAFGTISWKENFRTGLTADIQSNNTYNFFSGNWDNQFFVTGLYHKVFTDYTAFSGRIRWAQWFQNYYDKAGDVIRGIPDENLAADFMLSINLQESFLLFRIMPSEWFNNPSFRYFNFEEHITPFVDLALVQDPLYNRSFSFNDMILTAGIELTTFPYYFKTSYFRISFGVDMMEMIKTGVKALSDSNHRELYIGMGHYF